MSQATHCNRCHRPFAGEFRGSYVEILNAAFEVQETICPACRDEEDILDYQCAGTITNSLYRQATMRSMREEKNWGDFVPWIQDLYRRYSPTLLEVHALCHELEIAARVWELKHWLGPDKLQGYYRRSPDRYHVGQGEDYRVRFYGLAGRCGLSLYGTPQGRYHGAVMALIFDETSDEARGGINELVGTYWELKTLLQAATDNMPEIKPEPREDT